MRQVAHLGVALALAACAAPPPSPPPRPPAAPARLAVVNLTDYAWRVAFAPAGAAPARIVEITPRAHTEIELVAGPWTIEQAVLNREGRPMLTRRFPASFAAGENYRWPLATLRSPPEEGGGAR